MKFVDVELTDTPVDIKEFNYISSNKYPKIFIGVPIHHQYDQKRITFPSNIKSQNIFYIQPKPNITFNFFKGIEFKLSKKYNDLIEDIENVSNSLQPKDLEIYKDILKRNNLSCSDCFSYFSNGIFPINGKCIDLLSSSKIKYNNLYKSIFHSKNCFQCYSDLTVFILTGNYLSDEIYENLFQSEEDVLKA